MVKVLLLAISLAFAPFVSSADVRVIDGDTIDVDGERYRIHGIDAPEHGQKCSALGDVWPCGKAATQRMAALALGARVVCTPLKRDNFRRIIARCSANGRDLGAAMTSAGLAWAFTEYSNDYLPHEAEARRAKRGVWRAPTQPAWEYRAERWKTAETKAPDGCPIKGNISRNGKIYHPPWSPWYSRTRINPSKGERWFCDEAEAIAAGWRAPRWN